MKKKIIYIDMDGVIANFKKAADEGGWKHRPDKNVDYRTLEVMPGAKEALMKLNEDFDIFIASGLTTIFDSSPSLFNSTKDLGNVLVSPIKLDTKKDFGFK